MSAVVTKFICSTIMAIMGFIVVKRLSNSDEKLLTLKNIALMLLIVIVPIIIYNTKYSYIYTICVYIIMIIIYKYIFNISFIKSIIICSIMLIFLFALDFAATALLISFITSTKLRNTWYINIIFNCLFGIIMYFIFYKTIIGNKLEIFINRVDRGKTNIFLLFFILVIIAFTIILYVITINYGFNLIFLISFIVLGILFILVIILITERNSYDKLLDEYDNLFNYVKIFEDWIEKEQLNRHEYKNQLAVIRCMTREKKVKDKIDSILLDNINITNDTVNQLKPIPNGGLKGLLYYKIAIAENSKLNIELDISTKNPNLIRELPENKIKILCRLVGIYLDNAIEAAKETKKKIVSIEIYELNNTANIVISNTYNTKNDISRRNERDYSTKGEGRGKGLHFAKKMLNKNTWLNEEQSVIENYYIQKLIIKK